MKDLKITSSGKVDKRSKEYKNLSKIEKKIFNAFQDAVLKIKK